MRLTCETLYCTYETAHIIRPQKECPTCATTGEAANAMHKSNSFGELEEGT